jgi:hypothetical protein
MRMNEMDIESMNAEMDEAISHYEDHVKRDNDSIIMLRQQTSSSYLSATSMRSYF